VSGRVTDASTHAPLETASIILRNAVDSTHVAGIASGKDGSFVLHAAFGAYYLQCSLIGHLSSRSPVFQLTAATPASTLGNLALKPLAREETLSTPPVIVVAPV